MKFKKNICKVKFCIKIKQAFRNYSSTKTEHLARTSILSKHKAWVNPQIRNSLLCATVFLIFFAYKVTNWSNMEVTADNKVWFGVHFMSTSSEGCTKRQKKEDPH